MRKASNNLLFLLILIMIITIPVTALAKSDCDTLGHRSMTDGYTIGLPATTEQDGYLAYVCSRCNEAFDIVIIPQVDESSIKLSTAKCTYNGKTRTPSVHIKDANGNSLVENRHFIVTYPEGRKDIGNYVIYVHSLWSYDFEKELIFTIAPKKTDNLEISFDTNETVLSWNEVPGATGYSIFIYENIDSAISKKVADINGTSYTLVNDYAGNDLKLNEEYKVSVVTYTKLEDGTIINSLSGTELIFENLCIKTEEPEKECVCKCHGNFIQRIFFKIISFFSKIFNPSKRICACGINH